MELLTVLILIVLIMIYFCLTDIASTLRRLNSYVDFLEKQRTRARRANAKSGEDDVVMVIDGHKVRKSDLRR